MIYGKLSNAIKRTGTASGSGTKPRKKGSWVDDCGLGVNLALVILLAVGFTGKLPYSYANRNADSGGLAKAEQSTGSGSGNSGNGEARPSPAVSETSGGIRTPSPRATQQPAKGNGSSGQVRAGSGNGKGNAPVHKAAQNVAAKPKPGTADGVNYKKLNLPSYAEQWKWDIGNKIIADWGGGELGHKAAAIAYAESSYNCGNTTGDDGRSWGLFQINAAHKKRWTSKGWTRDALKDCWNNQEIAKEIYSEQGWRPWGAATHPVGRPRYLQFLK